MKKSLPQPLSYGNYRKLASIPLLVLLLLLNSTLTQAQSSNQFFKHEQFDPRTNFPLVFSDGHAVSRQQAAAPVWETIQSIEVTQPFAFSNAFKLPPTKLNLDQARNGTGPSPTSPVDYQNGNAGGSNAHYVEGWGIPYRLVITNLPDNGTQSVDIEWDIRHSSKNAIDFISNFDLLDYPAGSHATNFNHVKEAVSPTLGEGGTFSNLGPTNENEIPNPTLPTAPDATFDAIRAAGLGHITIFNGTITLLEYISQGALDVASSATKLRIHFTNTEETVIIAWSGHIAKGADWGVGNSASAVSGSPYHTRLISWDPGDDGVDPVSIGNQDRSLSADAVIDPPPCDVSGPSPVCPSSQNEYFNAAATSSDAIPSGFTYGWSVTGDASPSGSTSSAKFTVTAGTGCNSTYTVTLTIRTTNGTFVTSCNKTVSVVDGTPPVITGVGSNSTIDCPANPVFSNPTASDGCSTGTFTPTFQDVTNNSCGNARTVTRKWTATDGCGNTATASQTITVRDITPPVISGVGGPSTIDCPAEPVFSNPTASDACTATTVAISSTDETTTSCGSARTVTRKWTATDACGNTSTASQTITVRDITPPVISGVGGPVNISCPNTPVFSTPTASDACGTGTFTPTFSDSQTPGTCANNYSVTRKWTATDACGNTSTASQTITVTDNVPPQITCPADAIVDCNASTAAGAAGIGSATATDACGPTTVTPSDQTSETNCRTVITRIWTARDACGNTATCVQHIIKKDLLPPVICVSGGTVTASDNCTPANEVILYNNNGVWTAIDGSGNITTATSPGECEQAGRISTLTQTEEKMTDLVVQESKEESATQVNRQKLPVTDLSVQAFPNPFNDRVRFVVTSPEAGYGSLDVMNMLGQKVKTVFQGRIAAGGQSFELVLPKTRNTTLFYMLRLNGKQVTGKLVQMN